MAQQGNLTHYQILGVQPSATKAEISRAYKTLAVKCHPDKNLDDVKAAGIRMQRINEAKEVLLDDDLRREYDQTLSPAAGGVGVGFDTKGAGTITIKEVNGVDLIRRILQKESFGLTTPLITLSSGAKMGKTEKGAVWLDKKMYSPYDYWQFWRNTADEDVKKFLKYFTEIEVNVLSNKIENESDINKLKVLLANEATKILHGEKAARESENTAKETFHGTGISKNLPEINISQSELEKGINILDLLSSNNIVLSKSEARRAIKGKGIKINDELVTDEKKIVNKSYFKQGDFIKISYGKKKHFIIKST